MTEPYNFSWFVEGKLAAMAYPDDSDMAFLVRQGIKTLINLTEYDDYSEVAKQHGIETKCIFIPEFDPPTLEQIQEFVETVDSTKEVSFYSILHLSMIALLTQTYF